MALPLPPMEVVPTSAPHHHPAFSSSSSSSSSSGSSEQLLSCPTPLLQLFNGFVIQEPALIPTCILAAIIGFTGFARIRKTSVVGHFSYSISFLLFGCMMSDAMLVHCFLYNAQTVPGFLVEWVDVTLTSCVALSFGFNGLVDLGWINETSRATKTSMLVAYLSMGISWLFALPTNNMKWFLILYMGVIAVSCGIYTVAEFISTLIHRRGGLCWLGLGGFFGALGMYSIASMSFNLELCIHLGANLGGEFLWFLLSDFAMYSLYRFFLANKGVTSSSEASSPYPFYASLPTLEKTPPVLKAPPVLATTV